MQRIDITGIQEGLLLLVLGMLITTVWLICHLVYYDINIFLYNVTAVVVMAIILILVAEAVKRYTIKKWKNKL